MKTDYINRDEARQAVIYTLELEPWEYEALTKEINAIPAADVIPVEWIESQADFDKWNELVNRWNEYKEECK